jgi:hypothetical protein
LTTGLAAGALLAAALAVDTASQRTSGTAQGRVRPPGALECAPERLTAYIGMVTRFSRERDRTIVEIRTDWDTTEQVVIAHQGDGPEQWFLLRAKPFGPDGWKAIESAPGRLRQGIRASAWICEGGKNPIVDWNPAAEPPPPGG